uniref:RNase H type-1 domain-containing protein n=1 Tax=Chenopodium quinoa TaxID=63459 RepID=A0A803LVG5_CHEQI
MFANLCWSSWTSRNNIIHEPSTHNPIMLATGFTRLGSISGLLLCKKDVATEVTIRRAMGIISEHEKAIIQHDRMFHIAAIQLQGKFAIDVSEALAARNALQITIEAVGLGLALRDFNGNLLMCVAKRTRAANSEMAEALAVRYGIHFARRFGFTNIMLESDASNVVNAIKQNVISSSPILTLK